MLDIHAKPCRSAIGYHISLFQRQEGYIYIQGLSAENPGKDNVILDSLKVSGISFKPLSTCLPYMGNLRTKLETIKASFTNGMYYKWISLP